MSNAHKKALTELVKLVDTSFENNKSYARVAGYLEMLTAELIAELPDEKRQRFIDEIRSQIGKV